MTTQSHIRIGQYSTKGRKPANQDFYAALIPRKPLLQSKGMVAAIADGISSSEVSQIASQTSVRGFLDDYYATPESWSVETSAQKVILAINSWLYAQTRNGPHRYYMDKGYVCTFSALVIKSNTAHLFHIGDARVYLFQDDACEQLTEDHRLWASPEKSYLNRAMGMRDWLEIDYRSIDLAVGDIFVMATDGVYEFINTACIHECIQRHPDDLDAAAKDMVEQALAQKSDDNLTVQIVQIDALPQHNIDELHRQVATLPFPPELHPRMEFDGYRILRELHSSSRSHVYLAEDSATGQPLALKTPSVDMRDDAAYLERFLMEDWVAHRIDNIHVIKPFKPDRQRRFLYITTEYIEGQTLAQWMLDNPKPGLETVRRIIEQVARGLQALHRQEMLHQDLRPNNIMIDSQGTVKLLDFGSVRVAGVAEMQGLAEQPHILGTAQYTAPEYFLGEPGSTRSDLFSLGVIAYQMLSGKLPYGTRVARAGNRAAQHRLVYASVMDAKRSIPAWIDGAIRKAVHVNPHKRYWELSEFLHDMRRPNPAFLRKALPPLIERHPLAFWQGLSLILLLAVLLLLGTHPVLHG